MRCLGEHSVANWCCEQDLEANNTHAKQLIQRYEPIPANKQQVRRVEGMLRTAVAVMLSRAAVVLN